MARLHLGHRRQARACARSAGPARRWRAGTAGRSARAGRAAGLGPGLEPDRRRLSRRDAGSRQGDHPGAQCAASPARPRRPPRWGRLAGGPAPPLPRRGADRIGQADHPGGVRPRRSVLLARWRARRVRLRPQPAPRRPPVPERCVGDAGRRRPASPADEREGARHLPRLLPGRQACRLRGADH